jgi:hypothetical protein
MGELPPCCFQLRDQVLHHESSTAQKQSKTSVVFSGLSINGWLFIMFIQGLFWVSSCRSRDL